MMILPQGDSDDTQKVPQRAPAWRRKTLCSSLLSRVKNSDLGQGGLFIHSTYIVHFSKKSSILFSTKSIYLSLAKSVHGTDIERYVYNPWKKNPDDFVKMTAVTLEQSEAGTTLPKLGKWSHICLAISFYVVGMIGTCLILVPYSPPMHSLEASVSISFAINSHCTFLQ